MKKAVKIIGAVLGVGVPVYYAIGWQQKCIDRWREETKKQRAMFLLMSQWTNLKQEGRNLEEYFIHNEYKKIAIYGMGVIGQQLVKELRDSNIEVAYGIDRSGELEFENLNVQTMEDDLENVDLIVVTVIKGFDAIQEDLRKKVDCPIIGIEDVLNGL